MVDAVNRHFDRIRNKELTVNEFCLKIAKERAQSLLWTIPDEGYSMGSLVVIKVGKKLSYELDKRDNYAKSCHYSAKHGCVVVKMSYSDFRCAKEIGGVFTVIPPQRGKVKRVKWLTGEGKFSRFVLKWVDGYLYEGYHSETLKGAIEGGKRNILKRKEIEKTKKMREKALRRQYSFSDSILAGNCEAGTRAFIIRCNLSSSRKYRGDYLLKIANQKSSQSVGYVKRIIDYFAK